MEIHLHKSSQQPLSEAIAKCSGSYLTIIMVIYITVIESQV